MGGKYIGMIELPEYLIGLDLVGEAEPAEPLSREERIEEFLRLLSKGCTVRNAAAGVKVPWGTLYAMRRRDPEFAKRWDDAQKIRVDGLIAEAERRAMNGSDKLLMFLLTNYAPDKFKNLKQVDQNMNLQVITGVEPGSVPNNEDLV